MDGKLGRSGLVELKGRNDKLALERLVAYLETGQREEGVVPVEHPEYTRPTLSDVVEARPAEERPVKPPAPAGPPVAAPKMAPDRADGDAHVVPAIVIAGGFSVLVAGAYLQFTASPPETGDQSKNVYSIPGIALAVGGTVAIAAGAYLWVRASRATKATTSTPTVSFTAGGGTIGWAGSF
jgi:hypothetical protein